MPERVITTRGGHQIPSKLLSAPRATAKVVGNATQPARYSTTKSFRTEKERPNHDHPRTTRTRPQPGPDGLGMVTRLPGRIAVGH